MRPVDYEFSVRPIGYEFSIRVLGAPWYCTFSSPVRATIYTGSNYTVNGVEYDGGSFVVTRWRRSQWEVVADHMHRKGSGLVALKKPSHSALEKVRRNILESFAELLEENNGILVGARLCVSDRHRVDLAVRTKQLREELARANEEFHKAQYDTLRAWDDLNKTSPSLLVLKALVDAGIGKPVEVKKHGTTHPSQ